MKDLLVNGRFGTVIVPCPDNSDGARCVVFSDLDPGENGRNFSIPFDSIIGEAEVYTLSVAQQRDLKFRFISSRIMSRKNCAKTMRQSFKNIYNDDPEAKNHL